MGVLAKLRDPKITSDHLYKRTRRQLASSTLASLFLVLMSSSVITMDQLSVFWKELLLIAFVTGLFAILRNRVLEWICPRISFGLYYTLRRDLVSPFLAISAFALGSMIIGFSEVNRPVYGPILAFIFVIYGALLALGEVLSTKGDSSLKFAQSDFELKSGDFDRAFRWFNLGLYTLLRIFRQRGQKLDLPTLRLGARLCCFDEKTKTEIIGTISRTVLRIEDPKQFQELRCAIETLTDEGRRAISRGISPQPQLLDYFDAKHLTLKNIQTVLTIVAIVIGIVLSLITARIIRV